jgi:hypothetical protein
MWIYIGGGDDRMNKYTVLVIQEFNGVRANNEVEAQRMIEDIMKISGRSSEVKYFVSTHSVTQREVKNE